jgi:hypothetical protein
VVDQGCHDSLSVEIFDCKARMIDAGNCVGIIGGPVEGYVPGIRSLADSETKSSSLRVMKRKSFELLPVSEEKDRDQTAGLEQKPSGWQGDGTFT